MKIITWNINSVRLRLGLLKTLINEHKPDIISLQETKVEDHLFPYEAINAMGYKYLYYSGEKSYNGTAILSKIPAEGNFSLQLYNEHKRHIAIKIKDIELHNFYVPAGGDIPDINENVKFKHKLEYLDLMQAWFTENRTLESKLIILGDFNIAPHEHDVWSSSQLRKVVSHTNIERTKLIQLQNSMQFVDSARYFIPFDQKIYTWWSYRNLNWQKTNRGRRLDHIWVSANLQKQMKSIETIAEARSWLQPSDHVPYILNLEV